MGPCCPVAAAGAVVTDEVVVGEGASARGGAERERDDDSRPGCPGSSVRAEHVHPSGR